MSTSRRPLPLETSSPTPAGTPRAAAQVSTVAAGNAAPRRKPMARAARVTLYEREVRERLSQAALEILLDGATLLSEGQRARSLRGDESYYGSTMLTIDLAGAAERVRESCDANAARRVAAMMTGDARLGRRLREIVEQEATRIAGAPVAADSTDVRVRTQGATILVDVDLEGTIRPPSKR